MATAQSPTHSDSAALTHAPFVRPPVLQRTAGGLMLRYGCALAASGAALGLWQLATPELHSDPSPLFLASVATAAWYGCLGPGLLATALAAVLTILFTSHNGNLVPTSAQDAHTLLYAMVAVAIGWPQQMIQSARTQLQLKLNFTSAVATHLGEGVVALDHFGRVTFTNPAAEQILDWTSGDILGKPVHSIIHSACKQDRGGQHPCSLMTAIESGLPHSVDEDEFARRDGAAVQVAYTTAPIYADGVVMGSVLTFRDISERKQAIAALKDSRERYATLIKTSPDSIVVTDQFNYIVMASERAAQLYGFETPRDMIGVNTMELLVPDDRVRAARNKQVLLEQGNLRDVEYLAQRRDGSTFPVEISASMIADTDGKCEALIVVARDRTDKKEAERAVRQTEACAALQYAATAVLAESASLGDAIPKLLQTVCQGAGWDVGVFWTAGRQDETLRCRFLWRAPRVEIPQFETLTRQIGFVSGSGLPGRVLAEDKPEWIEDVVADPRFTRAFAASKEGLHTGFAIPVRMSGRPHAVLELFSREVRPENPEFMQMMLSLSNQVGYFIKRRQAEEALEHAAYHDPLTNLANRLMFKGRLERAILAAWPDNKPLALLLLDLNKFKQINDTHGHAAGDVILQRTAERLRYALRDSDTVARLGGDEFAVLLPGTDGPGAQIVAAKIVEALCQPILAEGVTLEVGASVGIALYPEHGEDNNTLMHHADVAMYCVKANGGGYGIYDPEQDERFAQRKKQLA